MKKYYRDMDIIRVIACIAILLYHLDILKGGYLAVCTFFVLSGYLSCLSAFSKEKFLLKDYYINRLKNIYLPLVIVVFISVFMSIFIKDLNWFNLKPEVTSILLGYNNYWQLGAKMDYFARFVSSPFIHLWYIGILLQFDLIFPFIFKLFKKFGDEINKLFPCVLLNILAIIASVYFYYMSLTGNIMFTYYGTFTRIFSILFGLSLGFMVHYYESNFIPKALEKKPFNMIIFYTYLTIIILLFIFVDATSTYFNISMLVTTWITVRLISYGSLVIKDTLNAFDKIIKYISSISYEIYLFQYPMIFLFQYIELNNYIKIPLIIISTVILSVILHFVLKTKDKYKVLKYILLTVIIITSLIGLGKYIISEDHTKEMNELNEQLKQNSAMLESKQEEYANKLKEDEEAWKEILNSLDNDESKLEELVHSIPVVSVGDSVMLGASSALYEVFPNGIVDAKVSRTDYEANGILKSLANKGLLSDTIVFNLGANGDCRSDCKREIMNTIGDRKLFWLTVTNDREVHFNSRLQALKEQYPNIQIIDWANISKGHREYFISDGLHLTTSGRKAFAEAVYNGIYQYYLDEHNAKKEQILKEHEEKEKKKFTFYGNDILLNAFDSLKSSFEESKFVIDEKMNYQKIKENITKELEEDTLTYNIFIALDSKTKISDKEYNELSELCKEHKIYILNMGNIKIDNENITLINFYEEIKENPDYLMVDKVHLTKKGNDALSNYIIEAINGKKIEE